MIDTREDLVTTRSKPLPAATVDILVALLDGPAHGYGIKKAIERRSNGRVGIRVATLYEALHRLERGGLISEVVQPAAADAPRDGVVTSRWRFYCLTAAGETALRAELERMDALVRHARARGLIVHREAP